jgi:hypothetical protein
MTPQQAFDKVWRHFIVEKHPPGVGSPGGCSCVAGCAVGILFPEEDRPILDSQDQLSEHLVEARLGRSRLSQEGAKVFVEGNETDEDAGRLLSLLLDLRSAHDHSSDYERNRGRPGWQQASTFHQEFEERLRSIAIDQRFVIPGGM